MQNPIGDVSKLSYFPPHRPKKIIQRPIFSRIIMSKIVTFNVAMSCGGCSGAVTRILGKKDKFPLIESVDANVETKVVKVTCGEGQDAQEILAALKKWGDAAGKSVELVGEAAA